MKVRYLCDVFGTADEVDTETWTSRRLILKRDGMGYSVHDTVMKPGTATHMCYRNHLETVYCIDGQGEVETLADGKVYPVRPGMLYALDKHDEHILRATSALRLVCVFNPPVTGKEVHDESGAYPTADVAA
jgi:L-ectoine synthase